MTILVQEFYLHKIHPGRLYVIEREMKSALKSQGVFEGWRGIPSSIFWPSQYENCEIMYWYNVKKTYISEI